MGEIRNSWRSKIASGRGLLIGIALGAIGAVIVVQLDVGGRLSQWVWAPPASGSHAATLEQLRNALAVEVQSRRKLEDRIEKLAEELALLRLENGAPDGNPLAQGDSLPEDSPSEEETSTEIESDLATAAEASRFDDEALLAHGVETGYDFVRVVSARGIS
jgi:hypothetical protein